MRDGSKASCGARRAVSPIWSSACASGLLAERIELEPRPFQGAELRQARRQRLGRHAGVRGSDHADGERLQGRRRHHRHGHVADRRRVVARGDREVERLIDRLDPPAELAAFGRPQRLGGLLTVGETIGRPRPIPGPCRRGRTCTDSVNESPRATLSSRLRLVEDQVRLLRPVASLRTERTAASGRSAPITGATATEAGRRPEPRPPPGPHGAQDRPRLDHLAEVDRTRFLDRLPDRRLAQGRRPVAVVAGVEVQELDRAGQPVVEARPALLDPHGDVEVGEPDEEGTQHAAIDRARAPTPTSAASRAARITESRWNSQSARPATITSGTIRPSTQHSPCKASSRRTDARRALIRDSN